MDTRAWNGLDRLSSGVMDRLSCENMDRVFSRDMDRLSRDMVLSHWKLCSRHCPWLIKIYLLHDCLTGPSLSLTFDFSPVDVEITNYCLN